MGFTDLAVEVDGPATEADDPATEVDDPAVKWALGASADGRLQARLKSLVEKKIAQIREIKLRKHANSILWIFNTLFFRDLLILFTGRELQSDQVLPKGKSLNNLAKHVLTLLSVDVQLVGDLASWAKQGQLYHLVGLVLGEGSWFLIADALVTDW